MREGKCFFEGRIVRSVAPGRPLSRSEGKDKGGKKRGGG